jgi:hypothetical protein
MQGGRDADHARAENDHIRRLHPASMIASYGGAKRATPVRPVFERCGAALDCRVACGSSQ